MPRLPSILYLSCLFVFFGLLAPISAEPIGRLPNTVLDVMPPSARVDGEIGDMVYMERTCRAIGDTNLRERIINVAAQEWAFFGMSVLDLTQTRESNPNFQPQPWRRTLIAADEAARVADSIAGYWSSTPNSAWILERQNQSWKYRGVGSRWRNPWSAAFISWVMCESGLGEPSRFKRAIAHHSYIDQAIMAREDKESGSAYVAYNPGEKEMVPGDMLCRGSRPAYRRIEDRRSQLGQGARSHCDIVVAVEQHNDRILLIGGNVRSWVRLKMLPGRVNGKGIFEPEPYNNRQIFAHLQLQAAAVPSNAFNQALTMRQLSCSNAEIPATLC